MVRFETSSTKTELSFHDNRTPPSSLDLVMHTVDSVQINATLKVRNRVMAIPAGAEVEDIRTVSAGQFIVPSGTKEPVVAVETKDPFDAGVRVTRRDAS